MHLKSGQFLFVFSAFPLLALFAFWLALLTNMCVCHCCVKKKSNHLIIKIGNSTYYMPDKTAQHCISSLVESLQIVLLSRCSRWGNRGSKYLRSLSLDNQLENGGFEHRKTEPVLSTTLRTASLQLSVHWVSRFEETKTPSWSGWRVRSISG